VAPSYRSRPNVLNFPGFQLERAPSGRLCRHAHLGSRRIRISDQRVWDRKSLLRSCSDTQIGNHSVAKVVTAHHIACENPYTVTQHKLCVSSAIYRQADRFKAGTMQLHGYPYREKDERTSLAR